MSRNIQILRFPGIFFYQMLAFNDFRFEMLDYFNNYIQDNSLCLSMEELFLHNEKRLFESTVFSIDVDDDKLFDFLSKIGDAGLRFNNAIDCLFSILGFDFLIRNDVFNEESVKSLRNHPLIINYGSRIPVNDVFIDRDVSYSAYSRGIEFKNPIIINAFVDESDFIKELIKRSQRGYFYKDYHSLSLYPKLYLDYEAGIRIALMHYIANFTSMLDVLSSVITFFFNLDISKYTKEVFYCKDNKKISKTPKIEKSQTSWSNLNFIIDELDSNNQNMATMIDCLKKWKTRLTGRNNIFQGRNILVHRGQINMQYEHTLTEEKGIYATFSTDSKKMAYNDKRMSEYFNVSTFCVENYSILLKLHSQFYDILFRAIRDGDTIVEKLHKIE